MLIHGLKVLHCDLILLVTVFRISVLLFHTSQIFTQKGTPSGSTSQCRTHTRHKPFSSRNRGSKFRLLECALILLISLNRIVSSTQVRVKAQTLTSYLQISSNDLIQLSYCGYMCFFLMLLVVIQWCLVS